MFLKFSLCTRKLSKKKLFLEYHSKGRSGKIEVVPTKEHASQRDFSDTYSPGGSLVSCIQIGKIKMMYTNILLKEILAVISNGT